MNFINNYSQPVILAQGAGSLALSLPDGEYRLTLADAAANATRWEIVGAVVLSGSATLDRGLEGTTDQSWPEGSVIYSALTAGLLQMIFARLVPAGGDAGQVLAKASADDFSLEWIDASSGGSNIGGATSGRLFVAYYDTEDSQRKGALIDLVTGDLVVSEGWASGTQELSAGVLGYSDAVGMLAMFPPGSTQLVIREAPDFYGFTASAEVADGSGAAFKPDGSMVLAVKHSTFATPFNFYLATYPQLQLVLGGDGGIPGVAPTVMPVWSPDGAYLYVPTGSGIERRDGSTFALVDTVLDEQIYQFALSADGSMAAVRSYNVGTFETTIRIVETTTWTVVASFLGYDQPAISGDMTVRMEFSPVNADQLAVAVQSNLDGVDVACVILDANSPGTETRISPATDYDPASWGGEQVAWSPNGDMLYVACTVGLHAYSTADWSYAGTLPNVEAGALVTLP